MIFNTVPVMSLILLAVWQYLAGIKAIGGNSFSGNRLNFLVAIDWFLFVFADSLWCAGKWMLPTQIKF